MIGKGNMMSSTNAAVCGTQMATSSTSNRMNMMHGKGNMMNGKSKTVCSTQMATSSTSSSLGMMHGKGNMMDSKGKPPHHSQTQMDNASTSSGFAMMNGKGGKMGANVMKGIPPFMAQAGMMSCKGSMMDGKGCMKGKETAGMIFAGIHNLMTIIQQEQYGGNMPWHPGY